MDYEDQEVGQSEAGMAHFFLCDIWCLSWKILSLRAGII